MDRGEWRELIPDFFRKNKWAIVVLLAGLVLMALPAGPGTVEESPPEPTAGEIPLQQQLEELLSALDGAGQVKVLLTPSAGEEILYQADSDNTESGSSRSDTVIITAADRSQTGLVRRVDPPVWQGAVVLCQGADQARVRLAVTDAVAVATGLSSDKIAVWKLK